MISRSFVSVTLSIAFLFCVFIYPAKSGEFSTLANPITGCPGDFFKKKAVVFGAITICATKHVNIVKLRHAANVAAKWLDNDDNGSVDQQSLLNQISTNNAIVVMSANGFPDTVIDNIDLIYRNSIIIDLASAETNPINMRDASQEEIHHLIMEAGWIYLYPNIFGYDPSAPSRLYTQWQLAERSGYYSYNDPSCDGSCKVVEFLYLTTAAYLGSSADLFSNELTLKSRTSLRANLPKVVEIIESVNYNYPRNVWPDGNYNSQNNIQFFGN